MIKLSIHSRDTKIYGADYIIDKVDKLDKLIPYLKPKIIGEWYIAVIEPPVPYIRELMASERIPEYVKLELFLERSTAMNIAAEHPEIKLQEKTEYEKFSETLKEQRVLAVPKVIREMYRRVGRNKDKLPDYIIQLKTLSGDNEITMDMVKSVVIDERVIYASQVLVEFLLGKPSRWKKYDKLVLSIGERYAYYAMRKYTEKLIKDKDAYLHNKKTEVWNIGDIDAYSVNLAYIVFHSTAPKELILCLRLLENREELGGILYDNC